MSNDSSTTFLNKPIPIPKWLLLSITLLRFSAGWLFGAYLLIEGFEGLVFPPFQWEWALPLTLGGVLWLWLFIRRMERRSTPPWTRRVRFGMFISAVSLVFVSGRF